MVDVTIRIEPESVHQLDDIVSTLESSGLKNLKVYTRFLIVTGTIARDQIKALKEARGLASVREARQYRKQT